jgi:hypothetical protein
MPRSNFLKLFLLASLMVIIAFPFYAYFYQHPSFTRLLKENIRSEAYRTASYLSALLKEEQDVLTRNSISDTFKDEIGEIEKNRHIFRVKVYSPSGEILYSSDAQEIGSMNTEDYFRNLVAVPHPLAKEAAKGTASLEQEIMGSDIIETYVPIMRRGNVIGVFEVYHDISEENRKLHSLVNRTGGILFSLTFVLLVVAVLSIYRADGYLQQRQNAEKEKEQLIVELQESLQNVKQLSGFLPICANCKKIRDDQGYWNQIETYIREHSEAEFSHGICPDCAKIAIEEIEAFKKTDRHN